MTLSPYADIAIIQSSVDAISNAFIKAGFMYDDFYCLKISATQDTITTDVSSLTRTRLLSAHEKMQAQKILTSVKPDIDALHQPLWGMTPLILPRKDSLCAIDCTLRLFLDEECLSGVVYDQTNITCDPNIQSDTSLYGEFLETSSLKKRNPRASTLMARDFDFIKRYFHQTPPLEDLKNESNTDILSKESHVLALTLISFYSRFIGPNFQKNFTQKDLDNIHKAKNLLKQSEIPYQ